VGRRFAGHAAADPARLLRGPGRGVHPLDDGDQRHDLPGVDQLDPDHRPILENMTELSLGPAAAFSVLVVVDRVRGHRPDRPGAAAVPRPACAFEVTSILGG
jgi:hypothetical protein